MIYAFMALLIFAVVNGALLMRRLESAHAAVWEALGRPTFSMHSGLGPRLALLHFVWSGRWRGLGDAVLSRYCVAAMCAEPLLAALLAYLMLG